MLCLFVFVLVCTHACLYACQWTHIRKFHATKYASNRETACRRFSLSLLETISRGFGSYNKIAHIGHSHDRAIHNDLKRFPQKLPRSVAIWGQVVPRKATIGGKSTHSSLEMIRLPMGKWVGTTSVPLEPIRQAQVASHTRACKLRASS